MTFQSILFKEAEDSIKEQFLKSDPPDFFVDLNLDQIIDVITAGREEYNLKPFYFSSLNDTDAVMYRHEVMKDMENPILFDLINLFARGIFEMREQLVRADKSYYKYHKERLFLDAVETYCKIINYLANSLSQIDLKSRGFLSFRDYLTKYINSTNLTSLSAETKDLIANLSTIKYSILIKEDSVSVDPDESEIDYSVEVEQTFEKFRQEAAEDYRADYSTRLSMNHVEEQIVDGVAKLYPDIFKTLDDYCLKHSHFLDEVIDVFDREIQFYISYLDYVSTFKQAGLKFCYPKISNKGKGIYNYECFDLALAKKLMRENLPIVSNDFYLKGKEREIVVSGPNQGGKTTFARTFGQLHFLGSLGCLVPGREAKLYLFDHLFTLFEKEEDITTLRGKLEDDLVRIHTILEQSTPNSIIIMNEILNSTTLTDAIFLSKKIMEKITQLDLLCVWVTFIDEISTFNEKTISMVSTVFPENPTVRTFKIVRKPADGLAYAISIVEKHQLTYDNIKVRIKS